MEAGLRYQCHFFVIPHNTPADVKGMAWPLHKRFARGFYFEDEDMHGPSFGYAYICFHALWPRIKAASA